jgi:hypothetical protein
LYFAARAQKTKVFPLLFLHKSLAFFFKTRAKTFLRAA